MAFSGWLTHVTRPNGLPDRPEANAVTPLEGEPQAHPVYGIESGDRRAIGIGCRLSSHLCFGSSSFLV